MSVVFEYIARNYINDYEYLTLKLPIVGGAIATDLLLRKSTFRHRVFLMFRQKWFLLLCVMQSEPMRTKNRRLRIPIRNREFLRKAAEKKYKNDGFDREAEWRLLEVVSKELEPGKAEQIANSFGSFDIHLVDSISRLLERSSLIQNDGQSADLDMRIEIATFAHLGAVIDIIKHRAPHLCDLLIPYIQFKYGLFFRNQFYPVSMMIEKLYVTKETEAAQLYGKQINSAIQALQQIDIGELPQALMKFSRPSFDQPSLF